MKLFWMRDEGQKVRQSSYLPQGTYIYIHPLDMISHLIYCMNNLVTNKPKLPADGALLYPYMG